MIQWYPGHMAKALREMEENLKLVDLVMILIDARIPESSINPVLEKMFANKKVVYIFSKADKADPALTKEWLNKFRSDGKSCVSLDSRKKDGLKNLFKEIDFLMKEKREKDKKRGLKERPIKTMIVGVPNVGKSTLINTLCGKKVAVTGDKPGVTKAEQWTKINEQLYLLDTPGVLWPKFETEEQGTKLVISGAIKDEIINLTDCSLYLINFLKEYYPTVLSARYGINEDNDAVQVLDELTVLKNNFKQDGSKDHEKTAKMMMTDYRSDLYGRITLDRI